MPELATTEAFYSARPKLKLGGQPAPDLEGGLLSLAVQEDTAGLFRCEATFGNWGAANGRVDFLFFDRQALDFGKRLTVEMGDGDARSQVFEGRIMAIEGRFPSQTPPEILVLAEDRLQDLRMVRKTRSFENLTITDLVQRIAGDHGLRSQCEVQCPAFPVIAQVNLSDLAFLRDCARRVDAEVWLQDDTLKVQTRAKRQAEAIRFTFGQRLREFSVCADLAPQRSALVVSGWDVAAKDGIERRADAACLGSEVGDGVSAQSVLDQSLGSRVERVVHEMPLNNDEANALAESCYRQLARRFIRGQGVCEGDARVRVGAKVQLDGLGALFSGAYYVTEVRHQFDQRGGFQTRFQVERAALGRA
jgi:phage protein D